MIDPSTWTQKKIPVPSLQLDPNNPRIPERQTPPTQTELIAELVANDGVYELAKDITEVGYLPDSSLIAVFENGKHIVVEGNRRLTALKLLISPMLAPQLVQAKFKKLSQKAVLPFIRSVKVEVAPSRDAAALLIQRKHTQQGIERWSRAMQARFFVERINSGSSIADVAKEFSIPPSEVAAFVQSHEMYTVACSLDLPPDVAAKVRNPREFPLTNLDRVYRNAKTASFLGISFDANKQLRGVIDAEEFKKGYAKIVTDVALGNVDSRTLNDDDDFDTYLGKFGASKPDVSQKGKFDAASITKAAALKPITAPKKTPSPPSTIKSTPPQKALVSKSFPTCSVDQRINDIIKELKTLPVKDYPNGTATLLRTFVDLLVSRFADDLGISTKVITEHRANPRSPKPSDWYPSARQLLNRLIAEKGILQMQPLALKAAQGLVADHSSPLSALILDSYMHNRYINPTEADLRNFWIKLEEAFKEMLTPQPPAGAKNGGV